MGQQEEELVQLFIEESREYLHQVEQLLLDLEEEDSPTGTEEINELFRAIHTIKGGAGFFSMEKVHALAHTMENILGDLREHKYALTESLISALLAGTDTLGSLLESPEDAGDISIEELVNTLMTLQNESLSQETSSTPHTEQVLQLKTAQGVVLFEIPAKKIMTAQKEEPCLYFFYYDLALENSEEKEKQWRENIASLVTILSSCCSTETTPDQGTREFFVGATVLEPNLFAEALSLPQTQVETITTHRFAALSEIPHDYMLEYSTEAPKTKPVKKKTHKGKSTPQGNNAPRPKGRAEDTSIRIHLSTIDTLLNLTAELVLTRNELLSTVEKEQHSPITHTASRLNTITSELQDTVLKTRLQPLGVVFDKFKRIVRDLSKKVGKEVSLRIDGAEVELDRTIIETIGDPLTHLVRNALDHGIESPDIRQQQGKPREGTLHISATRETDLIRLSIRDDGAGMDPVKIATAAVEKGVATREECDRMSEEELRFLIFRPGFSTAAEITDISGRGVGMDVVYRTITSVGGKLSLESSPNAGTTVTIKLPLLLSIMPCLTVKTQGEIFAIPQKNILTIMRIPPAERAQKIYTIGDGAVVSWEDTLIPLARLSDILGIPPAEIRTAPGEVLTDRRQRIADRRSEDLTEHRDAKPIREMRTQGKERRRAPASFLHIVIVQTETSLYGLVVDSLGDSEEIVVKPLGYHIKQAPYYSGATLLGNGETALILNIDSIQRSPHISNEQNSIQQISRPRDEESLPKDTHAILTVSHEGDATNYAVPMDLIQRIHPVKRSDIESLGSRRVISYEGKTVPLITPDMVLDTPPLPESSRYHILLFEMTGLRVGLMVSEIHDIEYVRGEIDAHAYVQKGIMGTLSIQGKTTAIIDLYQMVKYGCPDLIRDESLPRTTEKHTVLIAEDSAFFRAQLESIAEELNYDKIVVEDGQRAIEILRENDAIDLILTDIEMPRVDGLQLAKEARKLPSYKNTPIIACTTLSAPSDQRSGIEAGITEYLIKIDKSQIIETCQKYLP
ncbi:chemotaxis protein CheW [Chitinivibrio alkaliphilus]|uniref:Chemotaxis protein CheA n=1 Tax=Chitinivibrio alkaliphilus ACht1 TaxID=1313304 RepID=U7D5Q7_9BACT|nr:chemotaxis protein CheW [Chitinivibrio alkaliphilus]ERP31829.1 CheA signal transduction histidine kinase [Chitinivibrio alkaliphilus ACht1]